MKISKKSILIALVAIMATVSAAAQTAAPDIFVYNLPVRQVGDNVSMYVSGVWGHEGITGVQWMKDGTDIPGANSDTYTITGIQFSDAGTYSCRVDYQGGSVTSNSVTLTVLPYSPPTPLSFTGDRAVIASGGRHYIPQSVWNAHQTLYIDIVNSLEPEIGFENWTGQNSWQPELNSQWMGNVDAQRQQYIKIDVPGLWTNMYQGNAGNLYIRRIADPTLTIGAISKPLSQWTFPQDVPEDATLKLDVDSFFNHDYQKGTSWLYKVDIAGDLESATACFNYDMQYHYAPDDIFPLSYDLMPSANAATVNHRLSGACHFILETYCGYPPVGVQELPFSLNYPVVSAPVVVPLQDKDICAGETAVFSISATGRYLAYQWKFKPAGASWGPDPLEGATGATYSKENVQYTDAGEYICVVSNPGGTVETASTLTFRYAPYIVYMSGNQTVDAGEAINMTCNAHSADSYQWKKDGTIIPGATDETYSIASAQSSDAGVYTCDVSNPCSTVTSDPAVLTVTGNTSIAALSAAPLKILTGNGKLTIENAPPSVQSIAIHDISGRLIFNSQLSILHSIDVSHLPAGVYIVRAGGYTGKFVR